MRRSCTDKHLDKVTAISEEFLDCHLFPPGNQVKPAKLSQYKCTEPRPVSVHNRRLIRLKRRQSRASSSRLNTTKADEASLGNYTALSSEGQLYHSYPTVEDTYYYADFPQGDAVKVCRWLFHHHYI